MNAKDTPIIIVGGGPTGCTMALLLAKLGIRSIVLERRRSPTFHPSAHVINARSVEVWSQISPALAQEIMAASPEIHETPDVRWCTSLTGRQLGSFSVIPPEHVLKELVSLSHYRPLHLGQHKLEPILWKWAEKEPLIDFRTKANVESFELQEHGVTVTYGETRDARPGQAHGGSELDRGVAAAGRSVNATGKKTIHGSYLLACDGAGSTIRSSLGIAMKGPTLSHVASVFFHADIEKVMPKPLPLLAWIYNPDFAGVLIHHMRGDFILMTSFFPTVQESTELGPRYWMDQIPKALGRNDLTIKVKSCGSWTMTAQLADTFRKGRGLLIGDSAHRFPPTGGYGLNTGVQDAHNLAWKLAAVLEGRAGDALLDTYETERRPVAEFNCQQSVKNHFQMDLVTRHFRITGANLERLTTMVAKPPFRWLPRSWQRSFVDFAMKSAKKQTAPLLGEGQGSDQLRARVASEIPKQAEHFGARGVEMGFTYGSGVVLPENSPKPVTGDGIIEYRPTTWPGARMPHVVLRRSETAVGTHDLLDQRDFVLLCGPAQATQWRAQIARQTLPAGITLRVEAVDLLADGADASNCWTRIFEVGEAGAVLVRPDGHVAWRTRLEPQTGARATAEALKRLWERAL